MRKYHLLLIFILFSGSLQAQDDYAVPQKVVDSLQSLKTFAYANDPAYWIKDIPESSDKAPSFLWLLLTSNWLQWLLFIGLAAILLYVLVKMLRQTSLHLFLTGKKRKETGSAHPAEEQGYLAQVRQAESDGDYRSAIRYQYLQTLFLLRRGSWIHWRKDATNREYLFQLRKQPWLAEFTQLTRLFDKVWYGHLPVDVDQYPQLSRQFETFNRSLS